MWSTNTALAHVLWMQRGKRVRNIVKCDMCTWYSHYTPEPTANQPKFWHRLDKWSQGPTPCWPAIGNSYQGRENYLSFRVASRHILDSRLSKEGNIGKRIIWGGREWELGMVLFHWIHGLSSQQERKLFPKKNTTHTQQHIVWLQKER